MGRKDLQANIRGYRVDVTEIEANIRNLGLCEDVAVLVRQSKRGESRLVAYVVSMNGVPPSASIYRSELSSVIPSYMIPAEFIFLKCLPRTSTGKVDRKSLPYRVQDDFGKKTKQIAPRNEIERELTRMLKELMNANVVGIKDNIFDLGGDSMLAARLSIRLKEKCGVKLSITDIFNHPSIEQLASLIPRVSSFRN